jgi:hypothetical protein
MLSSASLESMRAFNAPRAFRVRPQSIENGRIHNNDVGHGREGRETAQHFGAPGGASLFQPKVAGSMAGTVDPFQA